LDIHITSRESVLIGVSNVYDESKKKGMLIDVPRTNASMEALKVGQKFSALKDHYNSRSENIIRSNFHL
jgi:hypothetical protein